MRNVELLKQYNEMKAMKLDGESLAITRTKLLRAMYQELSDFKTNEQVKIVLNEELSHFRKMRRLGEHIGKREISVSFILYRYLLISAGNDDGLRSGFKKSELEYIINRLTIFSNVYECTLLDYLVHKFETGNHKKRILLIQEYSAGQIQRALDTEEEISITESPLVDLLAKLESSDVNELSQSDENFVHINEQGYQLLKEKSSISAAMGLFILNFEKGNKGYASFYLNHLIGLFKEDSDAVIVPLLKLIQKEFLQ